MNLHEAMNLIVGIQAIVMNVMKYKTGAFRNKNHPKHPPFVIKAKYLDGQKR
jgi:hypothetical protein